MTPQMIIDEINEKYGEYIEMQDNPQEHLTLILAKLLIKERQENEFNRRMYETALRRLVEDA